MFYGSEMFADGKRPRLHDAAYNSWLLSSRDKVSQIIPNVDVSALSSYMAEPYANGQFILKKVGEPKTGISSGVNAVSVLASSVASIASLQTKAVI
jgi:hypothetical protein